MLGSGLVIGFVLGGCSSDSMGYQERALRRDSRAAAWFLRFAFRQVCPGVGKLKDGEQVPITLVVEDRDGKRESIEVMAPVKPLTARAPSRRAH